MKSVDPIPDTRITQMRSLTDDLRTLASDVEEQHPVQALARVRHYTRWILAALDEAEKELGQR